MDWRGEDGAPTEGRPYKLGHYSVGILCSLIPRSLANTKRWLADERPRSSAVCSGRLLCRESRRLRPRLAPLLFLAVDSVLLLGFPSV